MTSYCDPEYFLEVALTPDNVDNLPLGKSFIAKMIRPNKKYRISCTVLILSLDESEKDNSSVEAWMWVGSSNAIIPICSDIILEYVEPSMEMISDNEYEEDKAKYEGKHFKAYITPKASISGDYYKLTEEMLRDDT